MAKCNLRVPPKYPAVGDTWIREDDVVFTYTGINKGWVR